MGGGAVAQSRAVRCPGAADGADGLVHNGAGLAGSSRRPRGPSSSAGPESGVATAGRPSSSQSVSPASAGRPNRTVRCLLPLPST